MCSGSLESLLSATAEIAVLMHLPMTEHRAVAANNILPYLLEAGTARSCWSQRSSTFASHDLKDVRPPQTVECL